MDFSAFADAVSSPFPAGGVGCIAGLLFSCGEGALVFGVFDGAAAAFCPPEKVDCFVVLLLSTGAVTCDEGVVVLSVFVGVDCSLCSGDEVDSSTGLLLSSGAVTD